MKNYNIKISNEVKKDLELIKINMYNLHKNNNYYKKLLYLIKNKIESLSSMPHRIKIIDKYPWKKLGVRRILVKNYYIYFIIDELKSEIKIINILYSKIDQEKNLMNNI